jgi:PPOX class probable F420-dependent enzyme
MIKLSERQKTFLEGKNFAFVATINKDGSPQVTPTWVDMDGDYVLINVTIKRVKAKNITRDPRIAVAVAEQSNMYNMVAIQGKVIERIKGQVAEDHIDKMAKKYLGKDKYPNRHAGDERLLLKIEPLKVAGWGR